MATAKSTLTWEYGDFQTPAELVHRCLQRLNQQGITPASVLEPTCGRGEFLIQAAHLFRNVQRFVGVEINDGYLQQLHQRLSGVYINSPIQTIHADFFQADWQNIIAELPQPLLILGNPPWVTNSDLSVLQSENLPVKSTFQQKQGLDALTGKSNFDISEWMVLQYLEWLKGGVGTIAVLCKTSVARKVLAYAWKRKYPIADACIYSINAPTYFNASVDACFFILQVTGEKGIPQCPVYNSLESDTPSTIIGYKEHLLIANQSLYQQWCFLKGTDPVYSWRSGIKHDAAKIMELEKNNGTYRNGNNEKLYIESIYLYPLLKSSDIYQGRVTNPRKHLLVTQTYIGEATTPIQSHAPMTWAYLQQNAEHLNRRASSIYRNRPPFSIFGVGDYTFAPWKVAISGFYKNFQFSIVGPIQGRPVVFDDTVYFLPCASETEATFIRDLLNSTPALEFFESMTFWNDKRPITIDLLKRLNLHTLATHLCREQEYLAFVTAAGHTITQPFSLEF
jgi:hypothetical protein